MTYLSGTFYYGMETDGLYLICKNFETKKKHFACFFNQRKPIFVSQLYESVKCKTHFTGNKVKSNWSFNKVNFDKNKNQFYWHFIILDLFFVA